MNTEDMPKQVIVIRRDLKMRRGKEIAQGSHASMAFLTKRLEYTKFIQPWSDEDEVRTFYEVELGPVQEEWLEGKFTKVTLQVDTEADLLKVYEDAKAAGLEVHLICDSGATEFHGVPTNTCLAIGPDYSDRIDPVTRHLKLY